MPPLFNAYRIGIENWNIHTAAFYPDQEVFSGRMRGFVRAALGDVSRALGKPEVLCIKDPLLTGLFYWVNRLLRKQAKFVTVVRNPNDIVRSRQEVIEKFGRIFTETDARVISGEINHSYAHLNVEEMRPSIFAVRYEDLIKRETVQDLRAFASLPDISPENVWSEGAKIRESAEADPWFSPKYHRPINFERRLEPLSIEFRRIVHKECAPLIKRFGYETAESHA